MLFGQGCGAIAYLMGLGAAEKFGPVKRLFNNSDNIYYVNIIDAGKAYDLLGWTHRKSRLASRMTEKPLKIVRIPNAVHLDDIHPASRKRDWMDQTPGAFAYRCLPLTMANMHGWEIRCPVDVTATWDGAVGSDAMTVTGASVDAARITSHFGSGILTFTLDLIFRTPPGTQIWLTGPPNRIKDGIQPLTGLIETDWMPYPFTMNWKFTRPGSVSFTVDEPIAFFFPLQMADIEGYQPEIQTMAPDHPDFGQYKVAHTKRGAFESIRTRHGVEVEDLRFQKWYMRGEMPDGSVSAAAHHKDLDVKPVIQRDQKRQ